MDDTSVGPERISTSRPVTPAIARQDPAGNRRAKRKEICLGELVDHFGKQGAETSKNGAAATSRPKWREMDYRSGGLQLRLSHPQDDATTRLGLLICEGGVQLLRQQCHDF